MWPPGSHRSCRYHGWSTSLTGEGHTAFANASSLLTTLAYQRTHEAEADCFASRLMRRAGRPLQPMGQLLLHLDPHTDGAAEFISSHPATPERARRLADGGSGCEAGG